MKEFVSMAVAEQQAIGIMVLGGVIMLLIIYRMSHLEMPAGFPGNLKRRRSAGE
jgi:hypothetical protein